MYVWVIDIENKSSSWKLWGTLRFYPSGAKAPHLQIPVVCLITFSQTLGNGWVLQLHHACGLMRFLNPLLWNCHRLFVRKQLPHEYSRLKFWGTHILLIILCNYKITIWLQLYATSIFWTFVSNAFVSPRFYCSSENPWGIEKWEMLLPISLNLRNNGFLIKTGILTWNELININFLSL